MGSHSDSPGKIGFITCKDLSRYFPADEDPLYTHDDRAAVEALTARGHRVEPVVWGTPPGDLEKTGLDLVVMRSPWDYMDSARTRMAFSAWLDGLARESIAVQNPPSLMRWNLDKRYLDDLHAQGVGVVPSRFLAQADLADIDLGSLFDELGELVVKPCVSAAAQGAYRLSSRAQAEAFDLGSLGEDRDLLVQPYLAEIERCGEWSCVFLDGKFTHAVLKKPGPGSWVVQDELGGSVISAPPPAKVLSLARLAMNRLPAAFSRRPSESKKIKFPILYARVDIIPTGEPLLGELELIEPELFFLERTTDGPRAHEPTLAAFCDGVENRIESVRSGIATTGQQV